MAPFTSTELRSWRYVSKKGDSAVLGMWRDIAKDYRAILVDGEPTRLVLQSEKLSVKRTNKKSLILRNKLLIELFIVKIEVKDQSLMGKYHRWLVVH